MLEIGINLSVYERDIENLIFVTIIDLMGHLHRRIQRNITVNRILTERNITVNTIFGIIFV